MHFAIVQNWGLGDLVMTTPVISEFRRLYPDAKLTLVVRGKAQAALMAESPLVDQILDMPPSSERARLRRFFLDLRRQKIDVAFVGTRIGGWLPWLLKVVAGIPILIGDGRKEKYPLIYNVRTKVDPTDHRVDRMLRTFSQWSRQPPAAAHFPIPCSKETLEQARVVLAAKGLHPGRFIVVHPGSSGGSGGPDKRIPVEVASRVVASILDASPDASVAFIFGPDDIDLIASFTGLGGRQVVLSGQSLSTTIAVIAQSAGFIGTDSALGHLAAAFAIPTVTLFGPTIPTETAPYGAAGRVIKRHERLECQPCWGTPLYGHCPYGARCMHELPESEIVRAAVTWASASA
jgi:heptosyltransferase-2